MPRTRAWFRCGQEGHIPINCTTKNIENLPNSPRALEEADRQVHTCSQARAYASTKRHVERSDTVVTGTLPVLGNSAFTIFD